MANARELEARLGRLPDVQRTAIVSNPPMRGFSFLGTLFRTSGDSLRYGNQPFPIVTPVSASFFSTAGMRLLRGRVFAEPIGDRAPFEVMINEEMARIFWPGVDAIGQCLRFTKKTTPCYTIVGVVENGRNMSVTEQAKPAYYLPVGAPPVAMFGSSWIAVRAAPGRTGDVAAAIRVIAGGRSGDQKPQIIIMSEMLSPRFHAWRLGAWLFSALAGLALLVAAIGVYSALTYSTARRTHEIGVRMALGARATDVARVVIRSGIALTVTGIGVGIVLALVLGRLVTPLLYDVSPRDPTIIIGSSVVLIVVACIAAAVPAWRATRVDPAVALRTEA